MTTMMWENLVKEGSVVSRGEVGGGGGGGRVKRRRIKPWRKNNQRLAAARNVSGRQKRHIGGGISMAYRSIKIWRRRRGSCYASTLFAITLRILCMTSPFSLLLTILPLCYI